MKKLFFLYLFIPTFFSFSQKIQITDDLNYSTIHKNINHSFLKMEMMNDFNPIFNRRPSDDNFTLGESIFLRINNISATNYLDLSFKSNLYTDYQKDKNYMLGNRLIQPQYFVEISQFSVHYQYFLPKYKFFISIGGGVGINNKDKAIEGLALFMQGGKDGKGGYHALLNNNPGQDNISSGNIETLYFISPSLIKNIDINCCNNFKNKPFLQLQTGFTLGNKEIGSNLFFNTKMNLPLVQFIQNERNIFLLSLILQNEILYHSDGLQLSPEFGLETQLSFLTVGFASIFNLGNQNISLYKYVENVPLMRVYLKFNF